MRSSLLVLLATAALTLPLVAGAGLPLSLGAPPAAIEPRAAAPAAADQEPAPAQSILTDPADDVMVRTSGAGPSQAAPANAAPLTANADLVSLSLAESGDDFTFVVGVASLDTVVSFGLTVVAFTWNDAEYAVVVFRGEVNGDAFLAAELHMKQGEGFNEVADLDLVVDRAASTFTVVVPKAFVLDAQDRIPLRNDVLEDVWAFTEQQSIQIFARARFEDRMPDEGAAEYVVQHAGTSTGHLLLASADPVRVSNGGSTTFVYQVVLRNDADFEDEVRLGVADLPEGWQATVQSPQKVPPGEDRTVAVLASVPFAHTHGGFDAFNLTAESSVLASATASLRLGVLHTPIPQPAGHHPDVFLHGNNSNSFLVFGTIFPFVQTYMNTDPSHDRDDPWATPNDASTGGSGSSVGWFIPLGPELGMGLDFDLERSATFAGKILGRLVADGEVHAALYVGKGGSDGFFDGVPADWTRLAESKRVPVTLDVQAPSDFTLVLEPSEAADYVPYAPGQNLWLHVHLDIDAFAICCINPTYPVLSIHESKLTLPLNEYHDRLDGAAEAIGAVTLVADGPVEKTGVPEDIITYQFTLRNGGSKAESFALTAAGADARYASVVPRGDVALAPGETRRVTLAVELPFGAPDGQAFEVLLLAMAKSDPSNIAIARTKTTVDLEGGSSDETEVLLKARAEDGQQTPGPGALLAVAAAALAAHLLGVRRGGRKGV